MKIACFADAHLREAGSFPPFNRIEENGFSRELNNILRGFDFVADTIRKVKPDLVAFLGDLYHIPESLTTPVIHASSIALGKVSGACGDVNASLWLSPGNHDTYSDLLGITSISTLCGYGRLLLENDHFMFEKTGIHFVKFDSDTQKISAEFSRLVESHKKNKNVDLVLTHLDFATARYETGKVSNSVISPNLPFPVISGDIHLPQQVGSVHYCGSLVQNRFNRTDLKGIGGVLVYDTYTKKFTRYPNTYSKHYVKIEDFSQIGNLPYDGVVLQIKCKLTDEQKQDLTEIGCEYVYQPIYEKAQTKSNTLAVSSENPKTILRGYVGKNRPDAINLFDEVLGMAEGEK